MKRNIVNSSEPVKKCRPALTPEARENQLIALAIDLVEQRMLRGTASSQEVTHFLKLGSPREKLERERLQKENELLQAKKDSLESSQRQEELFEKAINAMKKYSGNGGDDYDN